MAGLNVLSLGGLPFNSQTETGHWVTIRTGPQDNDFINILLSDFRTFMTEQVNERIDNLDPGGGGAGPSIWPAMRTLTLTGAVTGAVSFDGSSNMSMSTSIADGSLTIAKTAGLQSALDGKLPSTGTAAAATKLITPRLISLTGIVTGTANFDGTANAVINTTVADDALSIAKVAGLQTELDGRASLTASNIFKGDYQHLEGSRLGLQSLPGKNATLTFRSSDNVIRGAFWQNAAPSADEWPKLQVNTEAGVAANTYYFKGDGLYIGTAKVLTDASFDPTAFGYLNQKTTTTGSETGLNADTLVAGDKYSVAAGNTNLPSTAATGWYIESVRSNASSTTINQIQRAFANETDESYFRRQFGGAWGSWRRVWHSGNFDPTSKLDINATAASANKWLTARTLTLSGAITGSVSIDGSGDVTLATTGAANGLTIASVSGLQAALDSKALATRSLVAGNGLTGGGDLTANRTFTLGTPSSITGSSINEVTATSHTHQLNMVYSPSDQTVAWDSYPQNVISTGQITSGAPGVNMPHITTAFGSGNRVSQIVFDVAGGNVNPSMYYRTSHLTSGGGGWTSFQKVWTDANQFALGTTQASAKAALGLPSTVMPAIGPSVLSGYFSIFPYGASHVGTQNGRLESYVTETAYSDPTWYMYYKDSANAVLPLTLRINGNLYTSGGTVTSAVSGGAGIAVIRTGSTANAIYQAGTTSGSVYFGQGPSGSFAVGPTADLNAAGNRWFHTNATGAYVQNQLVYHAGNSFNIGATQATARTALGLGSAAYLSADTNASANSVAQRNSQGDLTVRLIRTEYGGGTSAVGYLLGMVATGTTASGADNYLRPITIASMGNQLTPYIRGLTNSNDNIGSSQDLNNYTTSGLYLQSRNDYATADLNYPVTLAGWLEVISNSAETYVTQRYTVYSTGLTFVRTKYTTSWSAWRRIVDSSTALTFGNGLSNGSFDGSANLTITLGTPGTLSGSTTNTVTATSHTHALSANLSAWDGVTVASKLNTASPTFTGLMTGAGYAVANTTDAYLELRPTGGRMIRFAATTGNSGFYDSTNSRWLLNFGAGTNTAATFAGTATATDFILSSDRRLKQHISTLKGEVRLRPVRYQMKESGKWETGFIAQEVRKIEPTAVFKKTDGFLGVAYDRLIPVISQQVNHVEDRVVKLEKDNRALKAQLKKLERALAKLAA